MKALLVGLSTFLTPALALACPAAAETAQRCCSSGSSWTSIALIAGVLIGALSVVGERAIAGRRKT